MTDLLQSVAIIIVGISLIITNIALVRVNKALTIHIKSKSGRN